MREKPVTIEVRKHGEHWAVLAEEQLIALTVYEKGARSLEAILRGLLRYTSRKLFRRALNEGVNNPKPSESAKADNSKKKKSSPVAGISKARIKKSAAKKDKGAAVDLRGLSSSSLAKEVPQTIGSTSTKPDSASSH